VFLSGIRQRSARRGGLLLRILMLVYLPIAPGFVTKILT
jgi:hypothetical protein